MPIAPDMIFTALPNGVETDPTGNQIAHLSIFVSPRLTGGTTLADFALGNWPEQVAEAVALGMFQARFSEGTGPRVALTVGTNPLNPDFWNALFPGTTRVYPFQFDDNAARPLYSFSLRAIHDYLESLYTMVGAASADQFPDLHAPGPLNTLVTEIGRVRLDMERRVRSSPFNPGTHPDDEAEALFAAAQDQVPLVELYRALRFYTRGQQKEAYRTQLEPVVAAEVPAPLQPPQLDFHQVVSALGDHPYLLRVLGLVIDCTLTLPFEGVNVQRVRIEMEGVRGLTPDDFWPFSPWTRFKAGFRPLERPGSDLADGLLRLGDASRFDVFQTDVDGNALKTLSFATSMYRKLTQPIAAASLEGPQPESLPAQRNGGITVARTERDEQVFAQLALQKALNGNLEAEDVFADDVTRGFRVDVFYKEKWHSLCWRDGSYTVGDGVAVPTIGLPEPDEGYVKAASASSVAEPEGPNPPDLYLHEALFGWNNWSLVAPPPGQTISFDHNGDGTQSVAVRNEPNPPPPEFPLHTDFHVVPGTLPRLRFGEMYQLRARAVDLAGNGLPPTEGDFPGTDWRSRRIAYLRYEPVPPPVLVLREPVVPGESVEHLVVRSQAVEGETIDGIDPSEEFNAECRRFVAPPKISQILAEIHGAFDPFWHDPDAAFAIAQREAGTFNDPGPSVQLVSSEGEAISYPADFRRGDPLPNGAYTVQTAAALELPYLPDPLSVGLALQDFPGGPAVIERPFEGAESWPDHAPLPLSLQASDGSEPQIGSGSLFTSLSLPKATILKLRYSSAITTDGLRLMARYAAMAPATRDMVADHGNQHWMITPWREVTLVHAVDKPLAEPIIEDLEVQREPGDTFATLMNGKLANHSRSTGTIDLYASWVDRVDRLSDPGPVDEPREGHVLDRKIRYDEDLAPFTEPEHQPARHDFGDTKHRVVRYRAVGTTRYQEYFTRALTSRVENITVTGPEVELSVPSSARPDDPKVLYIVPTFKWVDLPEGRRRMGRGLRIYLARPWYSSGQGERLGVVLSRGQSPSEALRKYISEWGADPVFSSDGPTSRLRPDDFVGDPDHPATVPLLGEALRLREMPPPAPDSLAPPGGDASTLVDVVGFEPEYDPERGVYFADVVMDPGTSYYPFVRLALVRYQPESVDDAHLSSVVRTQFAQLVADRTATLSQVGTERVDVTVSGFTSRNHLGHELPAPSGNAVVSPEIGAFSGDEAVGTIQQPLTAPGSVPLGGLAPSPTFTPDPEVGRGRIVRAHIERLDNPAAPDLGWTPVGGSVMLVPHRQVGDADTVYWRGSVALSSSMATDDRPHRLVVRELELFMTDEPLGESVPVPNPRGFPIRQRLVYVDTFELSF